jgi:hypothetical protein
MVRISTKAAFLIWDLKGRVLGREVLFGPGVGAESVEVLGGEHLLREDMSELAGGLVSDVLQRGKGYAFGDLKVKACNWLVSDAAGIDELKVTEVGGDVEGEAVGGDSAGDVDADGADFSFASRAGLLVVKAAPNAGESGDATGTDAVDSAEADEGFFHHADEVDWTEAAAAGVLKAAEIEDGVADQLSGAVVGDVAPAIDFVQGDTAAGQQFIRGKDVGSAGVAAEGEDRGMLEQKDGVFDETIQAQSSYFCL